MKKSTLFLLFIAVTLVFSGCAHNGIIKPPKHSPPQIPLAYYLPKAEYTVTVDYELTQCEEEDGNLIIGTSITAEIQEAYVPDPKTRQQVDTSEMRDLLQSSDLTLSWNDNGTLKSINTVAQDRTSAVITNVLTAAANAVKLFAPTPGAVGLRAFDQSKTSQVEEDYESEEPNWICNAVTNKALSRIWKLKKEMKKVDSDLRLLALTDVNDGVVSVAAQKLQAISSEIARVKKDFLTLTGEIERSPKEVNDFKGDINLEIDTVINKWFTKETYDKLVKVLKDPDPFKVTIEAKMWEPTVELSSKKKPDSDQSKSATPPLAFRHPVRGELEVGLPVIYTVVDPKTGVMTIKKKIIPKTTDISVPQLGRFYSIPLKADLWEDRTIKVSFDASGAVTEFGYKTNSIAETATAAFGAIGAGAGGLRAAVESTRQPEVSEIDLIKLKKEKLALEHDIKCLELGMPAGCKLTINSGQ